MKEKIKILCVGLLLSILFVECNSQSNNSNDNLIDNKISEKDLYIYGLNAPEDVYIYFKRAINSEELEKICKETHEFPIVSIAIVMRDSMISECHVKSLRPIPITEKIIQNILVKKSVNFTFIDNYHSSNYDFRLELNRFCNKSSSADLK